MSRWLYTPPFLPSLSSIYFNVPLNYLQNYLLGRKETSEMADRNKEALLEVRWWTSTQTVDFIIPTDLDSQDKFWHQFLFVCLSGVFLWRLCVCARDWGHPVAEGGWEEVMEETLLPPQSFRDLLRPQRQSQGQWNLRWCTLGIQSHHSDKMKMGNRNVGWGYENQITHSALWYFLFSAWSLWTTETMHAFLFSFNQGRFVVHMCS